MSNDEKMVLLAVGTWIHEGGRGKERGTVTHWATLDKPQNLKEIRMQSMKELQVQFERGVTEVRDIVYDFQKAEVIMAFYSRISLSSLDKAWFDRGPKTPGLDKACIGICRIGPYSEVFSTEPLSNDTFSWPLLSMQRTTYNRISLFPGPNSLNLCFVPIGYNKVQGEVQIRRKKGENQKNPDGDWIYKPLPSTGASNQVKRQASFILPPQDDSFKYVHILCTKGEPNVLSMAELFTIRESYFSEYFSDDKLQFRRIEIGLPFQATYGIGTLVTQNKKDETHRLYLFSLSKESSSIQYSYIQLRADGSPLDNKSRIELTEFEYVHISATVHWREPRIISQDGTVLLIVETSGCPKVCIGRVNEDGSISNSSDWKVIDMTFDGLGKEDVYRYVDAILVPERFVVDRKQESSEGIRNDGTR